MIREQEEKQDTGEESNFREREGKFNWVTLERVFSLCVCVCLFSPTVV